MSEPRTIRAAKENVEVVRVAAYLANLPTEVEAPLVERFSVAKLRRVCDPFRGACWVDPHLTQREVRACLKAGILLERSYSAAGEWNWTREQHAARVAYLVVHPDPTPIEVDVGIPSLGCHVDWPVTDGNHRLAAAIYRRDPFILVDAAGACDIIERYRFR